MFQHRRRGGGGRGGGLALLMLAAQIFQMGGVSSVPLGTLGLVAVNCYAFLKPFSLPWSVREAAINVYDVWYVGEWRRLFLAAFFHGDEWHLYYNMASFLWKGKTLEPQLGALKFVLLNSLLVVLTSSVYVALKSAWALLQPENAFHILHSSAIGYSGVIFALKVLTTHRLPRSSGVSLFGVVSVPARLAVWAELAVISLISPNASFLGHLAGILVGMAYVHGNGDWLLHQLSTGFSERRGNRRRHRTQHGDAAAAATAEVDSGDERLDADYRAALTASLSQADLDAQQRARSAALARVSRGNQGGRQRPSGALPGSSRATGSQAGAAMATRSTTRGNRGDDDGGSGSARDLRRSSSGFDAEELDTALAASLSQAEFVASGDTGPVRNLECDPDVQAAILRSLDDDQADDRRLYPYLGFDGTASSGRNNVQPSAPLEDEAVGLSSSSTGNHVNAAVGNGVPSTGNHGNDVPSTANHGNGVPSTEECLTAEPSRDKESVREARLRRFLR